MKEQPARAIRRFEVLIMRPLNIAFLVAAGICLVKTAWILAVVMAVPPSYFVPKVPSARDFDINVRSA